MLPGTQSYEHGHTLPAIHINDNVNKMRWNIRDFNAPSDTETMRDIASEDSSQHPQAQLPRPVRRAQRPSSSCGDCPFLPWYSILLYFKELILTIQEWHGPGQTVFFQKQNSVVQNVLNVFIDGVVASMTSRFPSYGWVDGTTNLMHTPYSSTTSSDSVSPDRGVFLYDCTNYTCRNVV